MRRSTPRDRVALDPALAQVATHVPAVGIESLHVALAVGEHDQLGAERLDRVRLAALEGLREADAVPAASETKRSGTVPVSISRIRPSSRCGVIAASSFLTCVIVKDVQAVTRPALPPSTGTTVPEMCAWRRPRGTEPHA